MKFTNKTTSRGFRMIQFKDAGRETCDIQVSSNMEPHIWLGPHSPNAKILTSAAGWQKFELPDDVLISHRMLLSKKQCIPLALKLLKFGIFGEI